MIAIILTAASVAAAPAPAQAATPSPQKDEIVCHNEVVAGSRLPVKVCLRKSQREQMSRDGRDATSNLQRTDVFHADAPGPISPSRR